MIILERSGPVAVVTLNRPTRHNSLVPGLLEELLAALASVRTDSATRAMVLQAVGRSFSTGGDLKGFLDHIEDLEAYAATLVGLLNRAILALVELPIPVVGAVHGLVTGGSLGLVLGCDILLVAPEATMTPYYSVVGFSPDGGWTAMLPGIIGRARTAELLMRNLTMTAEEAVAWGLANRVVPAEHIRDEALRVAQEIATVGWSSICSSKRLLHAGDPDLFDRLEAERISFVEQITRQDARNGIIDFVEGRN